MRDAPGLQPPAAEPLQRPGRDAVVAPPVVGEFEVVDARGEPEPLSQPPRNLRVPIDGTDAGKQVNVVHQPCGTHAVPQIVDIRVVAIQLQRVECPATAEQSAEDRVERRAPDLLPVAFEDTAGDAGHQHHDVREVVRHRYCTA
jgi:hypothetical protein